MATSEFGPASEEDPYGLQGHNLVGIYRVGLPLHRSAMGVVYLGENTTIGTQVVIKIPDPRSVHEKGFLERFRREIQSLVDLRHPHVVRIQAQGVHDGIPFLILDHLDGGSLASRLAEQGRVSLTEVRTWVGVIADTLDYIHARGTVHRDVKPSNILFDRDGRPVLSDFGLAHFAAHQSGHLTETGVGVGSPHYMAPEQALGNEISAKADQYGLAATVYEALSGRPPFPDGTLVQVLVQKTKEPAPDIRALVPGLSDEVAAALMQALSLDPGDRHVTCKAFADLLGAPPAGSTPSTSVHLETGRGRRRGGTPWILALLFLAITGIGWWVWGRYPTRGGQPRAPRGDSAAAHPTPVHVGYSPRWLRPAQGAHLQEHAVQAGIEIPGLPQGARARMRIVGVGSGAWVDGRRENDTFTFEQPADQEGRVVLEVEIEEDATRPLSMRRDVVLDWTAPILTITSPAATEVDCAEPTVGVDGRVTDENPVILEVNGEPVPINTDGTFQHHVRLPADAPAVFSLVAKDKAGNVTTAGPYSATLCMPDRRYTIDLRSPAEGAFLPATPVVVEGRVEPVDADTPQQVLVNDRATSVQDGGFRSLVDVDGDGLLEIRVRIQGEGLAPFDVARTVTVDSTPPKVELDPPASEDTGPQVEIRGHVQDANPKEILANGEAFPVEADGSFQLRLAWRPHQEIVLVAIDHAGNKSTPVTRHPGRDAGVRIVLLSPRDGEVVPDIESGHVAVTATVRSLRESDRVLVNGERPLVDGDSVLLTDVVEGVGPHTVTLEVMREDTKIAEASATFSLQKGATYHSTLYQDGTRELWSRDLTVARAEASRTRKDVLVFFTKSDRSAWDRRVDQDVFSDLEIVSVLQERYVLVALDEIVTTIAGSESTPHESGREAFHRYRVVKTPCVILMLADGSPYARLGRGALRPDHVLQRVAEAYTRGQELASLRANQDPPPSDDRLTAVLSALARSRLLVDPAHRDLVSRAEARDPEGVLGVASALAFERAEDELRALRDQHAPLAEVGAFLKGSNRLRGRYYVETLFEVVEALWAEGALPEAKTLIARVPLDPIWEIESTVRMRYKALLEKVTAAEDR